MYNLGLMLFEMLTGKPPFTGALHEVVFKHISEPLPIAAAIRSLICRRHWTMCCAGHRQRPG